jgi:hypothetical protein
VPALKQFLGSAAGQAHSCVLVLMGVRLDGTKELIALAEEPDNLTTG